MQVFTDTKQKQLSIIAEIKMQYYELMLQPNAQKTVVYDILSKRHGKTSRTIQSYVKEKVK